MTSSLAGTAQAEPAIDVQGLSYAYAGDGGSEGAGDVLVDVNLTVPRGAFLALLGPNGGGKTTLIKCVLGLLPVTRGSVRVLGLEPGDPRLGGRVGYVPQHAELKRGFPLTVLEATLMGMRTRWPWTTTAQKHKALTALTRASMAEHAGARMDELSGGQRQRVLVARALVGQPELLVFDEPTANIDPQGKSCLYELLHELSHELTVVLVSHDLSLASAEVDSVAVVNRRLLTATSGGPSREMLELVYGSHEASCPMSSSIHALSSALSTAPLTKEP